MARRPNRHQPLQHAEFCQILQRARTGDANAIDMLARDLRPLLLERIGFMMGEQARRRADSSDFVQEALLQFVRVLPQSNLNDRQHCVRWLARVARNRIRDAVRSRRELALEQVGAVSGLSTPDPRDETPSAEARRQEVRERVADVLLSFPADQRRVIEMRNLDQLSFVRIGEAMGRSENAVQLLHTRAMTKLGRSLRALA